MKFKGAYINGRFIQPRSTKAKGWIVKRDPGNLDRKIGQWCPATFLVDDAVQSATGAFPKWAWLKESKRFSYLKKFQRILKKKRHQMAELISSEMGKPLADSQAEVNAAVAKVDVTIKEGMDLLRPHSSSSSKYYRYHPRGVVGLLGPFNFPLHLPNNNYIPALATGNTIVFKPSELTPFTGQAIAECFHEARLPDGVFNLVQGGGEVGAKLVGHPDIKGVLFVGSDATGHKIQKLSLRDPGKICVLEMGGKNAAIVFDDANLNRAVNDCVSSAFSTSGQRCNALSRILLHESIAEKFIEHFLKKALEWKVGYFANSSSQMGPLVDEKGMKKFFSYQRKATREGAKTLLKSEKILTEHPGYYVSPSVHQIKRYRSKPTQKGYCYDEIFGPDVALYTFRSTDEAVRIHNDCRYGLVGSVFSRRRSKFQEMYRTLEVGNLCWNRPTIGSSPLLPFGGVKASGNHFPAGLFSPYYCTYPVAIQEP